MRSAIIFLFIVTWIKTAELLANKEDHTNVSNEKPGMAVGKKYKPDWSDLDTRPLPQWYDRAKVGIFLHWGVYSVPGYGLGACSSEWFWRWWKDGQRDYVNFMQKNYPLGFTYQQFGPMFTAEFFDPDEWVQLFKKAGAKYVVLTSKHHDGFTLFPSKQSFSWNSVDIGPHRDLVRDLSKAVRKAGLEFGLYHSLYEWYHPLYLQDRNASYSTYTYPDIIAWPDLKQLVNNYKPSVIWSDGEWSEPEAYWNSTNFIAWLYNESPVKDHVVVNDRWGNGTHCQHGDFFNCFDRYDPRTLVHHKWENAFTIDTSWGYRHNIDLSRGDILTMEKIVDILVNSVSCGGNVLINVGPTKQGTIAPIFQDRLLQIGEWLDVNGEAIYESSPWVHQNDTINGNVWYTCKKTTYNALRPTAVPDKTDKVTAIYAMFLDWPKDNVLKLGAMTLELNKTINHIELLGLKEQKITWSLKGKEAHIHLPLKAMVSSKYAWTLKFSKV